MKKILTISLFAFLLFSFGTAIALPTAYIQNSGGGNNNNLGNLYNYTASNSIISIDDWGESGKNDVNAIPEPASLILLGLGLVGAGFLRRHK